MAMPHQMLPSYRCQTATLAERRPFLASHPPQYLSQSSTLPLLKKSVPVQPQISREHTHLPICWKWAVSQAPCHTLSWEPLHLLVVSICTKPSVHRLWAALETPRIQDGGRLIIKQYRQGNRYWACAIVKNMKQRGGRAKGSQEEVISE